MAIYEYRDLSMVTILIKPLEGLGFRVWGLGFGVWGLGFGVWGLGFTYNPAYNYP